MLLAFAVNGLTVHPRNAFWPVIPFFGPDCRGAPPGGNLLVRQSGHALTCIVPTNLNSAYGVEPDVGSGSIRVGVDRVTAALDGCGMSRQLIIERLR